MINMKGIVKSELIQHLLGVIVESMVFYFVNFHINLEILHPVYYEIRYLILKVGH